MVGLNKNAVSNLGKQFMGREVKKIYIAIVDGIIEKSGIAKIDYTAFSYLTQKDRPVFCRIPSARDRLL